jgi:hypothetical protein
MGSYYVSRIINEYYLFIIIILRLVHLTVYMKSILVRLLKKLYNVISCTPLKTHKLQNSNHKIDPNHFISNGKN